MLISGRARHLECNCFARNNRFAQIVPARHPLHSHAFSRFALRQTSQTPPRRKADQLPDMSDHSPRTTFYTELWRLKSLAATRSFMSHALDFIEGAYIKEPAQCTWADVLLEEARAHTGLVNNAYMDLLSQMNKKVLEAARQHEFTGREHLACLHIVKLGCPDFSNVALMQMRRMLTCQSMKQLPGMLDAGTRTAFVRAWWELKTWRAIFVS